MVRFLSLSISRRATVISRCSNYPAFTSLANHQKKKNHQCTTRYHCHSVSHTLRINLTHKFGRRACRSLTALQTRCTYSFLTPAYSSREFQHVRTVPEQTFLTSNAAVKFFFKHDRLQKRRFSIRRYCSSAGSTVHAWKSLFTRRSYCSSVEKSPSQWKMLFVHAARRSRGALLPLSKLV